MNTSKPPTKSDYVPPIFVYNQQNSINYKELVDEGTLTNDDNPKSTKTSTSNTLSQLRNYSINVDSNKSV